MPTLNWIGKDKVVNHHHEVPFRVLEHKYGFRADDETDTSETHSGNKIIHGDNLEALKALLPEYEGRIDCIYIDPPYNTGEERWVYNDNVNDPHILKWLGEVVGKEGEDLSRHDKWLCMMYPRLTLLHQLLRPEGAIFISIDDNEYTSLKLICDEIFGKNCFVANVSWQRAYSTRNDKDGIPTEAEHLLVYGKEPNWNPNKLDRTEEMDSKYGNPDNDENLWRSDNSYATGGADHQGMVYAVQHPFTGELLYPVVNNHWRYGQSEMLNIMNGWCEYELRDLHDEGRRAEVCGISADEVRKEVLGIVLKEDLETSREKAQQVYDKGPWPKYYFTKGGYGGIARKTYLNQVEGRLVSNLWRQNEVGHTDEAKKELKEIFEGKSLFDTPKPTRLIERILDIATDDNSIILDCFAGSGTTAHAVLLANHKKHSNRKFILVELMDYADATTAYRVKKAMTGYQATMKHEEIIYNKKLTAVNLHKVGDFLKEAEAVIEREKTNYAEISRPKPVDNCIQVLASRVEDGVVAGLGGSFDFYELGLPLFKEDGNLNEDVDEGKIREYIYYSETKQHLERERSDVHRYLLDRYDGVAYYFYYEKERLTTLNMTTLTDIVRERAEQYIIYADSCTLSKEQLVKYNIVFKKIPRDIQRF